MTGALIALAAGAVAGAGATAFSGYQQRKAAKKQEKLQAQANALQEKQMLAQAAQTPQQRQAAQSEAHREMAKAGLRQTLLAAQPSQNTRLGGNTTV